MYGFQMEWSLTQAGVITVSREQTLTARDLAPLEEKMLRRCEIPHVLPIEFAEVDNRLTFRYRASGKRVLSKAIRHDAFALKDCYRLLYATASVIDDAKTYMLDEGKYILHEDYVFLGKENTDVLLMYLPLSEIPGKGALQEEFRMFARRIFEHANDFHGYRVNELLDFLKERTFGIEALKNLLLEIVKELEADSRSQSVLQQELSNEHGASEGGDSVWKEEPLRGFLPFRKHSEVRKEQNAVKNKSRQAVEEKEKKGAAAFGLTVFMAALAWGWYSTHLSEGTFIGCLGFTLLLIAVFCFALRKGLFALPASHRKSAAPPNARTSGVDRSELDMPATLPQTWTAMHSLTSPDEESLTKSVDLAHNQEKEQERRREIYYDRLPLHTTILATSEKSTAPLPEMEAKRTDFQTELLVPPSGLEIRLQDGVEFVPLVKVDSQLIIGRKVSGGGLSVADYEIDAIGISRQHLSFTRSGGEYVVKDMASKNGSFLNEDRMIPHRNYSLHDGDKLRIASVECIFKSLA